MPYVPGERIHRNLEDASQIATAAGWAAEERKQWCWFATGETTLWLYKRTNPIEEIELAWQNSLKRWLIENEVKLPKTSSGLGRLIVQELLTCLHLPLDPVDYDDFRERYLIELVPELYPCKWDTAGLVYRKLIDKWKKQFNIVAARERSRQSRLVGPLGVRSH